MLLIVELVQEEQDSEEEDLQNGRELAGMKVRHDADELNEGETMILTLADRGILDDRGDIREDAEELENVLVVRSLENVTLERHIDVRWGAPGIYRGFYYVRPEGSESLEDKTAL